MPAAPDRAGAALATAIAVCKRRGHPQQSRNHHRGDHRQRHGTGGFECRLQPAERSNTPRSDSPISTNTNDSNMATMKRQTARASVRPRAVTVVC